MGRVMKISKMTGIPIGDKYITMEERFFKKYKYNKELTHEVQQLLRTQSIWYFKVFLGVTIEQKEQWIRKCLVRLDREK